MDIIRIPTHYAMQITYMSDSDKAYIFDSLMRLSIWDIIDTEKSMRWWIVLSIWTEAVQLENKASSKKWKPLKIDIAPMVQPMARQNKKDDAPNPSQSKSKQTKSTQVKTNQNSSKEEWEQALEVIDKKETILEGEKEYWNPDINKTLLFLTKNIWCDTFAESQKLQRQYAKHILNLWKEIGSEEMKYRLDRILEDKFKAKNSNKIAFIYKELKSFIHAPETEIFKC